MKTFTLIFAEIVAMIYFGQVSIIFNNFGQEENEPNTIDRAMDNNLFAKTFLICIMAVEISFYFVSIYYFHFMYNTIMAILLLIPCLVSNVNLLLGLNFTKYLHHWYSLFNKIIKVMALIYVIGICLYLII